MKLTTKTILYYLLVSVPLLIISFLISYFLINRAVNENLNEVIWNKKIKAEALINTFTEPRNVFLNFDSSATIRIDTSGGTGFKYSYLFKLDPEENEQIEYRALKSYYNSKGTNYLITIIEPRFEKDDLIDNLLDTFLITIAFLVTAFFVINWIISKTLWKPFYKTIAQMENYELRNNIFESENTSTKEFKKLNTALKKMTSKAYGDYLAQKEFTENASHESQTPLAVIKARIDLLMQSPNLKESEMEQLQVMEQAVGKLSSLNKGLLLLTRIGNDQFKEKEEVDISAALDKTLILYEEMISAKNISVDKKGEALKVKINPSLADILLNNLIQNAIRHNKNGGSLIIETSPDKLVIKNNGEPLQVDPSRIFERFRKNDASAESLGLGLALVKSIAEAGKFKIEYSYTNGFHTFTLQF